MLLPDYDCSTCTAKLKIERGCEGKALLPVKIDGVKQDVCPRRPLLDDPLWFSELMMYYRHYKNGFLPVAGGVDNQPHKLMMLLGMIDAIKEEVGSRSGKAAPVETRPKGNPFADQMKPTGT